MILLKDILKQIFSSDVELTEHSNVVYGQALLNNQLMHILGVKESTFLGVDEALIMAGHVIDILESKSPNPVLLLVDVAGQKLSMRDEWLGMEDYFGHLLEALECLRKQGNVLISLVCNQALGGAFIAYGLMADTILALPEAHLAVMWLEGIAKVTKIPLSQLEELSKTSPVLAPGVENFYKLGGLHDVVPLTGLAQKIEQTIQKNNPEDNRALLGHERGGRLEALAIMKQVMNYI